MVSAAMVLASFGTTIMHLYLCVGIIGGKLFFSLIFIYAFPCQLFSKISLNVFALIILNNFTEFAAVLCTVYFMLPGCDWLTQENAMVVGLHSWVVVFFSIRAGPLGLFVSLCGVNVGHSVQCVNICNCYVICIFNLQ